MGRLANVTASGVLVLGLAVTGCGGSSSTTSSNSGASNSTSATQTGSSSTKAGSTGGNTQTQPGSENSEGSSESSGAREHVPTNAIKLSSPAFKEAGPIPALYTCDGGSVSPPFHWSKAPHGSVELVLLISNFEAPGPLISWTVAGLKPTLTSIAAGKLPAGAVVGRNSFGKIGYTLCPPKGSPLQHYAVVLYALPHSLRATTGFPVRPFAQTAAHTATYSGLAGFTYTR